MCSTMACVTWPLLLLVPLPLLLVRLPLLVVVAVLFVLLLALLALPPPLLLQCWPVSAAGAGAGDVLLLLS